VVISKRAVAVMFISLWNDGTGYTTSITPLEANDLIAKGYKSIVLVYAPVFLVCVFDSMYEIAEQIAAVLIVIDRGYLGQPLHSYL
jgi:hypothetical protein